MEQDFKVGDKVVEVAHPELQLVVRRYLNRIYYCQNPLQMEETKYVFYGRELKLAKCTSRNG